VPLIRTLKQDLGAPGGRDGGREFQKNKRERKKKKEEDEKRKRGPPICYNNMLSSTGKESG